jgi:molecular chaperone GrpE
MPKNKDKSVNEEPLKDQDNMQETFEGHGENAASAEATETPVVDLNDQLAQERDKYLRLYSEFENFRRRTQKEKSELIRNASESVIKELLPVLDDLERAVKFTESGTDAPEGLVLIHNKLFKMLQHQGLKEMQALGVPFDADYHEAITQIDGGAEGKGKVLDVVEKGYILNDKTIRFAKVVIGQ